MKRNEERRRATEKTSAYADVQVELTLIAFRHLVPTVLLSQLGSITVTAILAAHFHDLRLWRLSLAMVLIGLGRLLTVLSFYRLPRLDMTVPQSTRWLRRYGAWTLLHCLTLCASTLYNFSHHDAAAAMLCAIAVLSQCAGLATRPGMLPWFKQGCSLLMLSSLAWSILGSHSVLAWATAGFIALFAYGHCRALHNQFSVVVEQLRSRRKLRHLAEHDNLTGLVNRGFFQDALCSACEQVSRPFAVLYIDLDRFKTVNDTFGHRIGDLLLIQVADRLKHVVRSTDLVARLGGDEFAVLQRAVTSMKDARALASRIVADLSVPFQLEGLQIGIGASIGIQLSSQNDLDPLQLLSYADSALYSVKQSGGGSFSFAGAESR